MTPSSDLGIFDRSNLVAWCIVPYDSRERGPVERAQMLTDLGLRRLAWDWRPHHVPQLGAELDALAEHGIELTAVWLPAFLPADDGAWGRLDPHVQRILDALGERGVRTQLWTCTELGPPGPFVPLPAAEHEAMVRRTADHLVPLAERAAAGGHTIGLYTHLGWAGEPENLRAVADELAARGFARPGLVYFQHHGHAHLDRFAPMLAGMRDDLLAFGLNGMLPGAHWGDGKVHPYGRGPRDVELARALVASGWRGPVGIIGHTMDDVEHRLRYNLEGLDWVVAQLRAEAAAADPAAAAPTAPVRTAPGSTATVLPAPPPARIPTPRWPH